MRWDLMVQPVGENPLKLKEYFFSLLLSYTKKKKPKQSKTLNKATGACILLPSVRSALQVPHSLEKDRISWEILGVWDDVLPLW